MNTMSAEELQAVFADPVAQELLAASIPARLAYTGVDGGPRVVPVGTYWSGSQLVIGTVPGSAKLGALHKDRRVAVTIDTEGMPPKVLLIRGTAEIEIVEGVPHEYLEAGRKQVGDDGFEQWSAQVRQLYDAMALIRITPTWAKILDFETRIPSAVERLVREKQSGPPQSG
jgi:Pyridoxamine 5'-phosphate oxidase